MYTHIHTVLDLSGKETVAIYCSSAVCAMRWREDKEEGWTWQNKPKI